MNIEKIIKMLIDKLKKDELSHEQILQIYKTFKKHTLSEEEKENANKIVAKIKSGELTEEMLIEKAKK